MRARQTGSQCRKWCHGMRTMWRRVPLGMGLCNTILLRDQGQVQALQPQLGLWMDMWGMGRPPLPVVLPMMGHSRTAMMGHSRTAMTQWDRLLLSLVRLQVLVLVQAVGAPSTEVPAMMTSLWVALDGWAHILPTPVPLAALVVVRWLAVPHISAMHRDQELAFATLPLRWNWNPCLGLTSPTAC